MACVILNTVVFMLVWVGQDQETANAVKLVNYVFLGIFTLEAIFKLIIMGKPYFNNSWNTFDFTVVGITFAGIILE